MLGEDEEDCLKNLFNGKRKNEGEFRTTTAVMILRSLYLPATETE